MKLTILKFIVVLIAFQEFIVTIMIEAGSNPYHSDSKYFTKEEMLDRAYCFLLLLEFTALAGVYIYAFAYPVKPSPSIYPETTDIKMDEKDCEESQPPTIPSYKIVMQNRISLWSFVYHLFSLTDLAGQYQLKETVQVPVQIP